jgi:hypothetical protein
MLAAGAARLAPACRGEPPPPGTVPAMTLADRRPLLALTVAGLAVLAGCGRQGLPTPGVAHGRVDELHGVYRGVRMGVTRRRAVTDRLGDPLHRSDSPYLDAVNAAPFLPSDSALDTAYTDVDFTYVNDHVSSISVYGRGARTVLGVQVGEPLSSVRRTYRRVRCLARRGGMNPEDPGCEVTAGRRRFLYFSGDPISVITLSTHAPIVQTPAPAVSPAIARAGSASPAAKGRRHRPRKHGH